MRTTDGKLRAHEDSLQCFFIDGGLEASPRGPRTGQQVTPWSEAHPFGEPYHPEPVLGEMISCFRVFTAPMGQSPNPRSFPSCRSRPRGWSMWTPTTQNKRSSPLNGTYGTSTCFLSSAILVHSVYDLRTAKLVTHHATVATGCPILMKHLASGLMGL